ncbi:MAG: class E sortase [Firmicutes bacterium]|nr:class E sortase [Bacillota bacterium]
MDRKKKRAKELKRTKRSLIGTLLILAGVSLALFPLLTNVYSSYFLAEAVEEEVKEQLTAEAESLSPAVTYPEEIEEEVFEDTQPEEYPKKLVEGKATLHIAALELMVDVGYGVEPADLRKGPGFYPQSGYPDTGNVAIAGHRTTYGAPFRHVDKLKQGDKLLLYYNETIYTYQVDDVFEIDDRDWSVIDPTEKPALTLTTCHPPGWATQRLVVRAYLVDRQTVEKQQNP